jgi:hypothetical protein
MYSVIILLYISSILALAAPARVPRVQQGDMCQQDALAKLTKPSTNPQTKPLTKPLTKPRAMQLQRAFHATCVGRTLSLILQLNL